MNYKTAKTYLNTKSLVALSVISITILAVIFREKRRGGSEGSKTISQPSSKEFPIHAPRAGVIAELQGETLEQSIEELSSFLDTAMATAGSGMSQQDGPESYSLAVRTYPRLSRVRKIRNRSPHSR